MPFLMLVNYGATWNMMFSGWHEFFFFFLSPLLENQRISRHDRTWRDTSPVSCPLIRLKRTLQRSFKNSRLQFTLFDWHLEIAAADGKVRFVRRGRDGRKRDREIERKWESRASGTTITLSPPLMTHAPISDWVDHGDSSLCSSHSSRCITFLWWRHCKGKTVFVVALDKMPLFCLAFEEGPLLTGKRSAFKKRKSKVLIPAFIKQHLPNDLFKKQKKHTSKQNNISHQITWCYNCVTVLQLKCFSKNWHWLFSAHRKTINNVIYGSPRGSVPSK